MFYDDVQDSISFIRQYTKVTPRVALILGSGLGALINEIKSPIIIPYHEIPNFPASSLEGHAGNLVFGQIEGKEVVVMQGRFHYYEGFSMKQVTYPIFVMQQLGVSELIITNACGGINENFQPGDLMMIEDFINGVSDNPLIGINDDRFGPRFPDMSEPYHHTLIELAKQCAKANQISYQTGVYTFFQGPYYETAAEIQFYKRGGSDAIGMSTVPETIAANYLGIKVLGIACITNMATGICKEKHSHEAVLQMAEKASANLCIWIRAIIHELA